MKTYLLWHPESPGDKIVVVRNWLQRLLYPKEFATFNEVTRYYFLTSAQKYYDILDQEHRLKGRIDGIFSNG